MKTQALKFLFPYLLALVVGTLLVVTGDAYLAYTDELESAQSEAEFWKSHVDALTSRGRWILTKDSKGNAMYRFAPKPGQHFTPVTRAASAGAK